MTAWELLNEVEAILVDSYGLDALERHFVALETPPLQAVADYVPNQLPPALAQWGETPDAVQAQNEMMRMLQGGG